MQSRCETVSILLFGPSGVGKSTLLQRLQTNEDVMPDAPVPRIHKAVSRLIPFDERVDVDLRFTEVQLASLDDTGTIAHKFEGVDIIALCYSCDPEDHMTMFSDLHTMFIPVAQAAIRCYRDSGCSRNAQLLLLGLKGDRLHKSPVVELCLSRLAEKIHSVRHFRVSSMDHRPLRLRDMRSLLEATASASVSVPAFLSIDDFLKEISSAHFGEDDIAAAAATRTARTRRGRGRKRRAKLGFSSIARSEDENMMPLPPQFARENRTERDAAFEEYARIFALPIPHFATWREIAMPGRPSLGVPCFDGLSCYVDLADGTSIRLDKVRKNDVVRTPLGCAAVVCVVRTVVSEGKTDLVVFPTKKGRNGAEMRITPWHPIRIDGKWTFPGKVVTPMVLPCEAVYSLVLSCHHSLFVNGVECVALGHGFTESSVVSHSFFGTERVIRCLEKLPGWERGQIGLTSDGSLIRSPITGRVVDLRIMQDS